MNSILDATDSYYYDVKPEAMGMRIRKFQENDQVALVALWESVFPDNPARNEPISMISAKLAVDDMIFLAEKSSKIVGACMSGYDGCRGWIYAVAVLPEHRRDRAGSQLVEHAIQTLKERGCPKVNLQIRSCNSEAISFYESLGFAVEDRISMGKLVT